MNDAAPYRERDRPMPAVIVGSIAHELHSFVPGTTGWEQFQRGRLEEGKAVFDDLEGTSLSGALEVAGPQGIEVLPTLMAFGGGGPAIEEAVYAELRERLLDRIGAALGRFEGVYLPLHGAMGTTERDDPEGELIDAVRALVGRAVPIVVSLDLHAHVTDRMVAAADAIIGYRTCPHTDIYETGARAMHLLADAMAGRCAPTVVQRKIPVLASSEAHDTDTGPMVAFQRRAREIEAEEGVLAVSIFTTQPWMDVPGIGWSVTVVTDGDRGLARQYADALAGELWAGRERYEVIKTPVDDALTLATGRDGASGPVVVADGADSPSAGAHGDGTALLARIVATGANLEALLLVTDPVAVHTAAAAGVGGTFRGTLGGRLTPEFFTPLEIAATVMAVTDGRYRSTYPPSPVDAGRTVVLRVRNTTVVVTEHPVYQLDLEPYRRLGLDPATFALVQAKSAGGYRAHYAPIAGHVIDLDTTGPCDSQLTRLPYRRITRPLWPFDPDLVVPW